MLLVSLLPYFGFVFMGWMAEMVFMGYFLDRLVLLFYLLLDDISAGIRSGKSEAQELVRLTAVYLVSTYLLVQFVGLILSLFSSLLTETILKDLLVLLVALFVFYGFQFVRSQRQLDINKWESTFFKKTVGLVLISGFTIMISFAMAVLIRAPVPESWLVWVVNSGLEIMLLLFLLIRFSADAWFFSRSKIHKDA